MIFVIVLQQIDGNIIGPKILGNSTGLSSFWVLFSILFFGGLWGFVGMIIGVPFFAVVYDVITRTCHDEDFCRNQRDDMLMAYDEQYVKKSKITPRQEKLWSEEEEKQEMTQEKTKQKEQSESIINEGESDEDRKEL